MIEKLKDSNVDEVWEQQDKGYDDPDDPFAVPYGLICFRPAFTDTFIFNFKSTFIALRYKTLKKVSAYLIKVGDL